MVLQHSFRACNHARFNRIYIAQCVGDRKDSLKEVSSRSGRSPADELAPMALTFRRRLLVGVGSASVVALGANFGGVTSFLLGLSPESGRNLKLDVIYPIKGYSRCIDINEGFEFIYPANWVGDQTLLYRAAEKKELERSLDPPPITPAKPQSRRGQNFSEPVVAFGPPGSSGELNVSVIVSLVPQKFSIEAFGGPKEVGEAIVQTITGTAQRPEVKGTLIKSILREDSLRNAKYYQLEFRVESLVFQRHNVAVCCARGGKLFTLNAQAPESSWPELKADFYKIADSFSLTS